MSEGKRESYFKRKLKELVEEVLPGFEIISHVDTKSGLPDWSVTGNGMTSWLEFKHATPAFSSRGVQVVVCRKLARAGRCRYVIFWQSGDVKRTLIVHPGAVKFGYNGSVDAIEREKPGHDLQFVVDYIKEVHGVAA